MSTSGGTRAIIAALFANLGIALTKFIAWALTFSSSMLAEAIHSVADSCNQLLLLIGGRRARRVATPQHPFGYGRERYIYAFIVSIVLFSVGGLFALYEAYEKAAHPEPIEAWQWAPVTVLLVAIVLETFSFRTAIKESNLVRGKASWKDFVRHARAPELPVVLLEDLAALVGLFLALFGVSMTLLTGNGMWDAVGTAAIGLLLVTVAAILAVEMKSLLIGESAVAEHQTAIERAVREGGEVEQIIHMKTLHLGPDELLVALKVAFRHDDTAADVARHINAIEERIRAAVPIARVVYLEPDLCPDGPGTTGTPATGKPAAGAAPVGKAAAGKAKPEPATS